ncbi:MAG: hypothetical protein ACOY9C_12870 [Pseudomonadota bacterium]
MELLTINQELEALEKHALASGVDLDAAALKRLDDLALTATPRTPAEAESQARYLTAMARGGWGGTRIVDAFTRVLSAQACGYKIGAAA